MKHGIFLSDIHGPSEAIPLGGIFAYIRDVRPTYIVLGGDVIDATGLHAAESMRAEDVKLAWFERDVHYAKMLCASFFSAAPRAQIIYLAGNHEERYARLQQKYPDLFGKTLDFEKAIKKSVSRYIPYGKASSYFLLGDTVFAHGDIFPEAHARKYATRYAPRKVVYGHQHDFQAWTMHRALVNDTPTYGLSVGCLCSLNPAWKKGIANRWVNGFVTFVTDGVTTTPSVHLMQDGKFEIGGTIYG